jgi:hypothetical protein
VDTHGLLKRLDKEWQDLLQSLRGLSDEAMSRPGLVGEWSGKDLLGHIATWEDEAIKAMGEVMRGNRPPRYRKHGGIDVFNARESAKKARLSLGEARRRLTDSHKRLLETVAGMPGEHWERESSVRRRLRLDTYGHYRIHTLHIVEWRKENGL